MGTGRECSEKEWQKECSEKERSGIEAGVHNSETYEDALRQIARGLPLKAHDIERVLSPQTVEEEFSLFHAAHEARECHVGKAIHVRGIIEFSNYCRQDCLYCGLRRSNEALARYRMSPDQIVKAASTALKSHSFGTFVLQSGEDPGYSADAIVEVVRAIKRLGPAVTLSVGQRPFEDYELWREAGADRFLLKFETSDSILFRKLKPTTTLDERLQCLINLRSLGYQIGTGIILGLPGQTREMVIRDLELMKELDPEMVSIGPFVPHPDTPLRAPASCTQPNPAGSIRAVLRTVALSRLMVPMAHVPATTALGVIGKGSREWVSLWRAYARARFGYYGPLPAPCEYIKPGHGESRFLPCTSSEEAGVGEGMHAGEQADTGEQTDTGTWEWAETGSRGTGFSRLGPVRHWNDPRGMALMCGANVIMPDVTPKIFRDSYEIYPGKASSDGEDLQAALNGVKAMIKGLGMSIASGRGDSPKPRFQIKENLPQKKGCLT